MSKNVRLLIIGNGDPELQQLIEAGFAEIGRTCETSSFDEDDVSILDRLSSDEVPVVIKPV